MKNTLRLGGTEFFATVVKTILGNCIVVDGDMFKRGNLFWIKSTR